MSEFTQSLPADQHWKVYRIRTLSSDYHLGIYAGAGGRRACAVLRGLSRRLGQVIDLQDSNPLIGGQSLFSVPPNEWIGKSLEIGTATTSPIQAVTEERDPKVIAPLTRSVSSPTADTESSKAAAGTVLQDWIDRLDQAVTLLRAAHNVEGWKRALKEHPDAEARLDAKLQECFLALDALETKLKE